MKPPGSCQAGDPLPTRQWQPTVLQLRQYAEASGDFNPIHLDEEFARQAGLPGVIAQGMLTMAQLGALLTDWLGEEGSITRFESRFENLVLAGDEITFAGVVRERQGNLLACDLAGYNGAGTRVISGRAEIRLKD